MRDEATVQLIQFITLCDYVKSLYFEKRRKTQKNCLRFALKKTLFEKKQKNWKFICFGKLWKKSGTRVLMSVCVSSSLNSGMTHVSHLHMTSSLSMMHPFQTHHQMAPSSNILNNGLDLSQAQQSNQQLQMQNSSSSSSSDGNEPNSEMLLALIARNKTLEGKFLFNCEILPSGNRNSKKKCVILSKCDA